MSRSLGLHSLCMLRNIMVKRKGSQSPNTNIQRGRETLGLSEEARGPRLEPGPDGGLVICMTHLLACIH